MIASPFLDTDSEATLTVKPRMRAFPGDFFEADPVDIRDALTKKGVEGKQEYSGLNDYGYHEKIGERIRAVFDLDDGEDKWDNPETQKMAIRDALIRWVKDQRKTGCDWIILGSSGWKYSVPAEEFDRTERMMGGPLGVESAGEKSWKMSFRLVSLTHYGAPCDVGAFCKLKWESDLKKWLGEYWPGVKFDEDIYRVGHTLRMVGSIKHAVVDQRVLRLVWPKGASLLDSVVTLPGVGDVGGTEIPSVGPVFSVGRLLREAKKTPRETSSDGDPRSEPAGGAGEPEPSSDVFFRDLIFDALIETFPKKGEHNHWRMKVGNVVEGLNPAWGGFDEGHVAELMGMDPSLPRLKPGERVSSEDDVLFHKGRAEKVKFTNPTQETLGSPNPTRMWNWLRFPPKGPGNLSGGLGWEPGPAIEARFTAWRSNRSKGKAKEKKADSLREMLASTEYLEWKTAHEWTVLPEEDPAGKGKPRAFFLKSAEKYVKVDHAAGGVVNFVSTNKLSHSFPPGSSEGEEYLSAWVKDPRKLMFGSVHRYPPKWKGANSDDFNDWPEFKGLALLREKGQGTADLGLIFDLLRELCGVSVNGVDPMEYFLNWLADLLQFPERKLDVAVIFQGPQGTGKGKFTQWFGNSLLGEQHSSNADTSREGMGNVHSTEWKSRIFCTLQEMKPKDAREFADILKSLISTDPFVEINEKFKPVRQIPNLTRYIFCTQSESPVPVEGTDRRYVFFEGTGKYQNDRAFFRKYDELTDNEETVRTFTSFLLNRDISGWDPSVRPVSRIYREAKIRGAPGVVLWLSAVLSSETPSIQSKPLKDGATFAADELFNDFVTFTQTELGRTWTESKRTFTAEFSHHAGAFFTRSTLRKNVSRGGEAKKDYVWSCSGYPAMCSHFEKLGMVGSV